MNRTACLLLLAASCMLGTDIAAASENSNGGTAGAYRRVGHSAALMAMGNAGVAFPFGPESRQHNPALVAWNERSVSADFMKLSLDRDLAGVHVSLPLKPMGAIGLSWSRAAVSGIPETTTWGELTGHDMSWSENLFSFGVALQPSRYFALGFGLSINTATFADLGGADDMKETAAGFDIGLSVHPMETLWLGASIRNLAASYSWDSTGIWETSGEATVEDDFPTVLNLGTGLLLLDQRLLLVVDYEASDEDAWDLRTGVEWRGPRNEMGHYELRAGYDDGSFSTGLGFTWPFVSVVSTLDYAVVFHENDPDALHAFTWSFRF
jgi:hypothetical protein